MAPTWAKRLRRAVTPPAIRTVPPPEPDPDHERNLDEARRQGELGERQLNEARRIAKPLADTAQRLAIAGARNHFSEKLEDMLQHGYSRPRGENR